MKSIIYIFIILSNLTALAQDRVNWINFEDLASRQIQNPKPIFVYIYADWCVYCKKMERVSFRDKDNIKLLNQKYYALKFKMESKKEIFFNGEIFRNQELKTERNPIHDLAKFLTGKNKEISLPAIIILDQNYTVLTRLHTYLSPKQMNSVLKGIKPEVAVIKGN